MQSLDFVETLNFREGNDTLYHLQGQLASGFKPRSHEGNDAVARQITQTKFQMFPYSHSVGMWSQIFLIRSKMSEKEEKSMFEYSGEFPNTLSANSIFGRARLVFLSP